MHELALSEQIVSAIVERTRPARVLVVHLVIGKVSGVVAESVRFCFDLVAAGSTVEGALLDIEEPPGVGRCRVCSREFDLDGIVALCPCGSAEVDVLGGDELMVRSVEVA